MRSLSPRVALTGACLVAAAALALALGLAHPEGGAAQVSTTLGIDADPTDNSATSLGNIDACVSVATGQTFDVDIFVTDVVDLKGWQSTLTYEPSVVRLAEADVELFLAGDQSGRLFNLSDPTPDQDGSYLLTVADTLSGFRHDGSGVLARVTLEAVGAGTSFLTLQEIILGDSDAMAIGDLDNNGWFDGSVGYAQVWVDEPCPGALPTPPPAPSPAIGPTAVPTTPLTPSAETATAEPSISPGTPAPGTTPAANVPTEEENGGFPWAVVAAAIVVAAGAAVVGGLALRWFLRRG